MKERLLIAITTFLFSVRILAGPQLPQAVTQYLNNPTEENAKQAVSGIQGNNFRVDLSSTDLLLVRNQIVAGGANSLRLVLTLIPLSGGGNLENLMALAAAAIRPQPNMFLRVVEEVGLDRRMLESILLMSGLEYVDRPIAKRLELEMRRIAISGAGQQDLNATRALCIQLLDTELKN